MMAIVNSLSRPREERSQVARHVVRLVAQAPLAERNLAPKRTALPSGTVTFLFADIEGSTKLAHALSQV